MVTIDAIPAPFNAALSAVADPPVMAARRWVEGRTFPAETPLINLSQAAPVAPPPLALRRAMADAAMDQPDAHLYGPVLGRAELRAEVAAQWSAAYDGVVGAQDVAITSGCNQAFCAAIATLAGPGDAVILPYPWYFNHKMWLDMAGVTALPLHCGDDGLPDPAAAAALIDTRTRAIVLVTPNNPTGAEYPAGLMDAFFDLAQTRGLGLVVDETYRDFHSHDGAPHELFARPDWAGTLLHLYSFSKTFRLTGHRVGALICGERRLRQAEKFLDTVTICPAQLGQIAALAGLRTLGDWVAAERAEVLARRARLEQAFAQGVGDWRLLSCGAYFAYLAYPDRWGDSMTVAHALADRRNLLTLPGAMFTPQSAPPSQRRRLRLAFANADAAQLDETVARLRAFTA